MAFIKSKKIWLILGVIIAIIAIFAIKSGKSVTKPEYVTANVEKGDLVQTVSATGKVESASETNLNFRQSGALAKIFVKVGEEVKSGRLLAKLQSSSQQSLVAQARAQLEQSEADFLSVKEGASSEEVSVSKAKVAQAEADIASAESKLAHTKEENIQNLLSLKEQALNKASETLFLVKSSIEDVNELINNSDYELLLKIYVFSFSSAKQKYQDALNKRDALNKAYPQYNLNSENGALVELMDLTDMALKASDEMLDASYDLISNVSVMSTLTQTIIESFKATFSTDQSLVAAKISAVQTAKSNLQTKGIEYQNSIKDAENAVLQSESALKVAKAELTLKQAGPRDFEINQAQAKVAQAQAALNKALADLADFSVTAPVDGIITKVNYEVGEFVSSANNVISLISESNLQMKVDVPESDIAKVMAGDEASITLDAFGSDRGYSGHVTFIDPAETIINDVVYYKVTVSFDSEENEVKSGMTANLIITTASLQNVLYIPQRAVYEKGSRRFVKVLNNEALEEREVITGLRADDGLIEIISGLAEGETIITFTKENK